MPTNVCTVYLPAIPGLARLVEVAKDMRRLGPPTIRMMRDGEHFIAVEGEHRVAAAAILGISINAQLLDPEDMIDLDSVDVDFGPDDFVGDTCLVRVKDFIDWLRGRYYQPDLIVEVKY